MSESTVNESPAPRTLRRLLLENLGAATVIIALLECWRPLYFLTDDNFDSGLPMFTGIGRRLARGESPFISDFIYGGHYNLLRDCTCFFWHPVYVLAALLANTSAGDYIIDFIGLSFLWVAVAGFVYLAYEVRQQFALKLGDARLTLCALSFTFSMIVLCAGPSWINFLANHGALPWLALGILQTHWRRGLGLTVLFSLHQLLGGYLAATVSNSLFLTLFAIGVAMHRRSFAPLFYWIGGYALAAVILSPLLLPAAEGFADSVRAGGLSIEGMDRYSMPAALLPFSYFFGIFSWYLKIHYVFGFTQPWYAAAFASCAASWMLVPALVSRARWNGLEMLCLGLVALAVLLVIRPAWVGAVMLHLPVLKSMRWPFREILQLQFFLHFFFVLRPLGGSLPFQRVTIATGVFIFVCPLFFLPAPSFNPMTIDRQLYFSGTSERYWTQVKSMLRPGEVIVPVINPDLSITEYFNSPYSLIGAYNYPILFEVTSATGYSLTVPADQLYLKTPPKLNTGIFVPSQEADVLEERPNVRFIALESIHPLRITLSSPNGPIDLTPLLREP